MSNGLDATVVLPDLNEKESKPYRTSPYTVRQYMALPYAQRCAVDADCNERAGITYTTYSDETSEKPYTVGRATRKVKSAQQAQLGGLDIHIETPAHQSKTGLVAITPSIAQPSSPMTTYVHPAPSPALHTLNTPELIEHDEMHPDNEHTSAVLAPGGQPYDIVAVAGHYVKLTASAEETDWTHWGYSPFCGGDTHSFAVNEATGQYKCFTSLRSGYALDLVMFMEEIEEPEAIAWLEAFFTGTLGTNSDTVSDLSVMSDPTPLGEGADGPACAYPGYPKPAVFEALAEQVVETGAPTAPAAPLAMEGKEYSTTDYDMFHLLPENRAIDRAVVRRLVEQIGRKNLLFVEPILVTTDFGIIDGQHRREAARELGVPIFYKIAPELTEDDIAMLNSNKKNWLGTDYLHFWTVKGVDSYVQLTAFRQRHPTIGFSNAKMMLSHPTAEMSLGEFRAGRWRVYQVEVADRVAELLERIKEEIGFKQAAQTRFVAAVYHIANVEGFDADRLIRKLNMQPRALRQQATHRQYLELFNELYNYKTTKENHLRFI